MEKEPKICLREVRNTIKKTKNLKEYLLKEENKEEGQVF